MDDSCYTYMYMQTESFATFLQLSGREQKKTVECGLRNAQARKSHVHVTGLLQSLILFTWRRLKTKHDDILRISKATQCPRETIITREAKVIESTTFKPNLDENRIRSKHKSRQPQNKEKQNTWNADEIKSLGHALCRLAAIASLLTVHTCTVRHSTLVSKNAKNFSLNSEHKK